MRLEVFYVWIRYFLLKFLFDLVSVVFVVLYLWIFIDIILKIYIGFVWISEMNKFRFIMFY